MTESHHVGFFIKSLVNAIALTMMLPAAMTCWLEEIVNPGGEGAFSFWGQITALLPGHIGVFLRRAFYRLTLRSCDSQVYIGFGAFLSHREAVIERDVYVGPYAVIGSAYLRSGCLIGTRVNLLSGSMQHVQGDDGRWISDGSMFRTIEIGQNAWVGEAATIMADVGAGSIVSAGAVVSTAVIAGVVVAGNPARFVRHMRPDAPPVQEPPAGTPVRTAVSSYLPFIDWLKCLGMMVIVYGHVAAWAPLATLRPINLKQLGVACFLFATGCSLVGDRRPPLRVAFNRLFEVYLFGIPIALISSVIAYRTLGRILVSNYLPYFGGVNVFFDVFPANPTSWYIATYVHVIALWVVVLRRVRITPRLILATVLAEIAIRAILMQTAGLFVAYMLLPNWATVFLLGCWYGIRPGPRLRLGTSEAIGAGLLLAAGLVTWWILAARLPFQPTFPFMTLDIGRPIVAAVVVSAIISMQYAVITRVLVAAIEPFQAPRVVRFIARNTLIIFLAHMPVYYAVAPALRAAGLSRLLTSVVMMIVLLPGLALVSEVVRMGVRPTALRERIYALFATASEIRTGAGV